jgi:hypothetical protein
MRLSPAGRDVDELRASRALSASRGVGRSARRLRRADRRSRCRRSAARDPRQPSTPHSPLVCSAERGRYDRCHKSWGKLLVKIMLPSLDSVDPGLCSSQPSSSTASPSTRTPQQPPRQARSLRARPADDGARRVLLSVSSLDERSVAADDEPAAAELEHVLAEDFAGYCGHAAATVMSGSGSSAICCGMTLRAARPGGQSRCKSVYFHHACREDARRLGRSSVLRGVAG